MGLGRKANYFLGKKMVLSRKTNFFLGKTKKTIFLEFGRIVSTKMFFLFLLVFPRKVGFPVQNYLFPRKKLVFHSRIIFFLLKTKKSFESLAA